MHSASSFPTPPTSLVQSLESLKRHVTAMSIGYYTESPGNNPPRHTTCSPFAHRTDHSPILIAYSRPVVSPGDYPDLAQGRVFHLLQSQVPCRPRNTARVESEAHDAQLLQPGRFYFPLTLPPDRFSATAHLHGPTQSILA